MRLKIGKYELRVPKDAVSQNTLFRMKIIDGPVAGVSLEAWDSRGNPVTKFKHDLELTLPYEDIEDFEITDPSNLLVVNIAGVNDETILEVVNTRVDKKDQTVTGRIAHFSVWCIAIELSKELSPGID
jgi:hypothetical protein